MAKNKKKSVSDKVRAKKHNQAVKVNPFEVQLNKQKHKVLGQKVAKHEKGMLVASRSKGIKKREATLREELRNRGKVNEMKDLRIGENDPTMSLEEKMQQRFSAAQRVHRSGLYNLNDDDEEETLTHMGQSLAELEKFEDPKSSDEDEEDADQGRLGANMVEQHFGGGTLTKPDENDGRNKSWKERMEEIIAKSKKAKFERQHEKEKNIELTEELDATWKSLMGKVSMGGKQKEEETATKAKESGDYDIVLRELKFEAKGKATDRLKTDEEIAQEEKEKLEKLEAERMRRMKGITAEDEKKASGNYRSADDLDDGFDFDTSAPFKAKKGKKKGKKEESDEEGSEEEAGGSEEGSDDEDAEQEGSEEEEDSEEESEEEEEEDEESGDEAERGMEDGSDLDDDDDNEEESKPQTVEEIREMLMKKKAVMEGARAELPYMFPAPQEYQDLHDLLDGHDTKEQLTIVERIRKCHHPSLKEGNKEKLETLYGLLVEHYMAAAAQSPPRLDLADGLVRHLYQLSQMSPAACSRATLHILTQAHDEYVDVCEERGRGVTGTLDMVFLLKLVGILFPTSDLRHEVVTPASLFLSQLLTHCSLRSLHDVTAAMLFANVALEYVSYSKRFFPEALLVLRAILFLAVPNTADTVKPDSMTMIKSDSKHWNLLRLSKKCAVDGNVRPISLAKAFDLSDGSYVQTEQYKVSLLWQCLTLLSKFCQLYETLPAFTEIFSPLRQLYMQLPVDQYPEQIKELIDLLEETFNKKSSKVRNWIKEAAKGRVMLRLLDPLIDSEFDPERKQWSSTKLKKDEIEVRKMKLKIKKERKSALRELRKDAQFIASEKLKDQLERDETRKRKVGKILSDLASQEGDHNAMKRQKNSAT